MKSKLAFFVLITSFALTSVAFAGSPLHWAAAKNSANVELTHPVTVGGTAVPAGQYKVSWEGTGADVKVSFLNGKTTVATAPARLVNSSTGAYPAVTTDLASDNTRVLRSIDLKNVCLQFEPSVTAEGE